MIERADNTRRELVRPELIRGCGRYSAQEVRDILSRNVPGVPDLIDARQLGMPDGLFLKLLEQRAAKLGLACETRTAPAPTPVEDAVSREALLLS